MITNQEAWINELICPAFWRLEEWNQGGGGAMFLLKAIGQNSSLPCPSPWWLPKIVGIPWLVNASSHLCLHLYLAIFSVCPLFLWIYKSLDLWPALIQYNFTLTNYNDKDPIFKYSYVLMFLVGGNIIQSTTDYFSESSCLVIY